MSTLFGTDLSVLVGFAAHDTSSLDLQQAQSPARRRGTELVDLARLDGRDNLAQALILRLLTPRGSLAGLGHAAYGSRLHELIGQSKTDSARHLCRAFVLEALAEEPRLEPRAVAFAFQPDAETPSSLSFTLTVRPRGGGADLVVPLEVGL
jgi:phage baseplate assembly protein W